MRYAIGFLRRLLALLCLLLLLYGLLIFVLGSAGHTVPAVFGYQLVPVETGDMEPALAQGDAAVLAHRHSYSIGDVVACPKGNTQVFRRIIGTSGDDLILKADATQEESLLHPEEITGQVTLALTYMGVFLLWLKTPNAMAVLAAVLLLILLLPRLLGMGSNHAAAVDLPENAAGGNDHGR